jgi:protein-L-isoaspartate(D-aspartate) O-methyltransferase
MTRTEMIEHHLRGRGIVDERVLDVMARVPREAFVPPELVEDAYDDRPLPIAAGQTISQPYIVALMTEALQLEPGDTALEIGTGSGYGAAVLGELAARVDTVERHRELADEARRVLASLGYANVHVHCADGSLGWRARAPYQAIAVTAGGPKLPVALLAQLAIGGRLVMPVGSDRRQELVRVTRLAVDNFRRDDLGEVMFVPLIGAQGWADPAAASPPAAAQE